MGIIVPDDSNNNNNNNNNYHHDNRDEQPPSRAPSFLSLAMAEAENSIEGGDEASNNNVQQQQQQRSNENGLPVLEDYQRRAALHQTPPTVNLHIQQQQKRQQQQQHDVYGYAYNNHIEWNQIHPSSNIPTSLSQTPSQGIGAGGGFSFRDDAGNGGGLSKSPQILASTPPSGAFLNLQGPPSSGNSGVGVGSNTTKSSPLHLPTQAATTLIPPPFPSRPKGLVFQTQQQQSSSPSTTTTIPTAAMITATAAAAGQQQQLQDEDPSLGFTVSMTAMDLLHRSPFQQGVMTSDFMSVGHESTALGVSGLTSLLLPPRSIHGHSALQYQNYYHDNDHEGDGEEEEGENFMPFAVEMDAASSVFMSAADPTTTNEIGGRQAGSSSATTTPIHTPKLASHNTFVSGMESLSLGGTNLGASSSALVTSFAQKCDPAHTKRLSLFDSKLVVASSPRTSTKAAASSSNNNSNREGGNVHGDPSRLFKGSGDGGDGGTSGLAAQLAEFREFAASQSTGQ